MDNFREMVSKLAKGRNFPEGSYALIVATPDNSQIHICCDGKSSALVYGICNLLTTVLTGIEFDTEAAIARDKIKDVLIADELRRFQNSPIGGDAECNP